MSQVADLTDAKFSTDVESYDGVAIVDFWAPWCGPCKLVAPIVEELSKDFFGQAKFFKLNTDDNEATAQKYGISAIPTILMFKNGRLVNEVRGFRPKPELKKEIERALRH